MKWLSCAVLEVIPGKDFSTGPVPSPENPKFVGTTTSFRRKPRSAHPLAITQGKRTSGRVAAADSSCTFASRRLFVRDKNSGTCFLVDSGSDASLVAASRQELRLPVLQTFRAANGTSINVYGRKSISVNFGLRRNFTFSFYICDVSCAILGADFLYQFNLSPDLRKKRLIDNETNFTAPGRVSVCSIFLSNLLT